MDFLGTSLVWAVVWLPIGVAVGVYQAFHLTPSDILPAPPIPLGDYARVVARSAVAWTIWGMISGAVFGLLLIVTERRRTLLGLSFRRTSIWGALGAMALPIVILVLILAENPGFQLVKPAAWTLSVSAALGAGCALGTLMLAKRAPPALLDSDPSHGRLTSA